MTKALLAVDIQNDYFPGGAMELDGSNAAAEVAASVKSQFKQAGHPVFMIQHIATRPDATFFLPDTRGVEIHESLGLEVGDHLIVKHYPNSFRETDLLEGLRKNTVDELIVVGMMTHMCIDTTVRAANDLGFKVTVIADACATKNLSFAGKEVVASQVQTAYLAALDGSFANVISSSDFRL